MSDKKTIEDLKEDFLEKRHEAEKAAYEYFCACDLGPDREFAYEVYNRILYLLRK